MLNIIALRYISLSEINKFRPEVNRKWIKNNEEEFKSILHQLGMDISVPWDYQENIQHRNYFNEIVTCDRIVGNERTDSEWTHSGLASQEAIDKSRNSRLLVDIYRMKGMVDVEGSHLN